MEARDFYLKRIGARAGGLIRSREATLGPATQLEKFIFPPINIYGKILQSPCFVYIRIDIAYFIKIFCEKICLIKNF